MPDILAGQVAVVTGAGQGIGRGVARMFATEGARVAVVDLDGGAAAEVAEAIIEHGGRAHPVACDVGERSLVEACIEEAVDHLGPPTILVNAAISGCPRVPLLETTEDLVEQLWRSGPLGTLFFIQACYPHLKGGGAVINFASGAGLNGDIGYAAYGPAKEAVRSLTKVAARELGQDGIRVNAVFPAATTRLMEAWIGEDPEGAAAVEASIPLRRFGDPDVDIPLAVVFLASDAARYITGHTLCVDGGSCKF